MTKLPDEALPDTTAAPELASVPLALAEKTTVPEVVPATKVQVKVVLAPAGSKATDAGTGLRSRASASPGPQAPSWAGSAQRPSPRRRPSS